MCMSGFGNYLHGSNRDKSLYYYKLGLTGFRALTLIIDSSQLHPDLRDEDYYYDWGFSQNKNLIN